MSILIVGTVALDSIETPFGAVDGMLGGSALYISLAARFYTRPVQLVAVVGADFPPEYRTLMEVSGLDLRGLQTNEHGRTFAWAGRYHYDLNERDTLRTDLNVLETFDPVVPLAYRASRIVCLGNLDPDIQMRVLDQVDSPEFVVCDTMNFWIENTPDGLRSILRRIDCLIVNDSEARELSGEPNLIKAAPIIRAMGPDVLIIKKGEHGALLFCDGAIFSVPAFPLEDIQDPTGAGDAFMGGFAGHLARETKVDLDALKRAVVYGSAMASFTVEAFGPERLKQLSKFEIDDRVKAFKALSAIPSVDHLIG